MQCANLRADRNLGHYWERQFCVLAARRGNFIMLHQSGREQAAMGFYLAGREWRRVILPDVTLWSPRRTCCEHHEVKHKEPLRARDHAGSPGYYGLERYRFEALLEFARRTGTDVHYTIHNHRLAGGRGSRVNSIDHWFTANVCDLDGKWRWRNFAQSWVNGESRTVEICYWPETLFQPLIQHFASNGPTPSGGGAAMASTAPEIHLAQAA